MNPPVTAEPERRWKHRMNWLGLVLSLPAIAAWIWVMVELTKEETWLLLWVPVTLLVGWAAHAWPILFGWKWRGATVLTAFLLHVVLLFACMAVATGPALEGLSSFLGFAVDVVRWDIENFDPARPLMALRSLFLVASLAFTLLHPIHPTFWTAMTSSIGFSLFLGANALMLSHAA